MAEDYRIAFEEKPEESAWGIIGQGVRSFNLQQAGDDNYQRLCFVLNDPDQEIVGGIFGAIYWEWFFIDLLWVKEGIRGHGHGHRLLSQAEDEAKKRGALKACLDTFSFQAPDFYRSHGYTVFGELQDYPSGHQRYFMEKQL